MLTGMVAVLSWGLVFCPGLYNDSASSYGIEMIIVTPQFPFTSRGVAHSG